MKLFDNYKDEGLENSTPNSSISVKEEGWFSFSFTVKILFTADSSSKKKLVSWIALNIYFILSTNVFLNFLFWIILPISKCGMTIDFKKES